VRCCSVSGGVVRRGAVRCGVVRCRVRTSVCFGLSYDADADPGSFATYVVASSEYIRDLSGGAGDTRVLEEKRDRVGVVVAAAAQGEARVNSFFVFRQTPLWPLPLIAWILFPDLPLVLSAPLPR